MLALYNLLLTTTMIEMENIVKALEKAGLRKMKLGTYWRSLNLPYTKESRTTLNKNVEVKWFKDLEPRGILGRQGHAIYFVSFD